MHKHFIASFLFPARDAPILKYVGVVFEKDAAHFCEHLVSPVWVHCKFLLYKFNSRKVTTRKLDGERGTGEEYAPVIHFTLD